ncbi:uncharacterized protein N7498_007944 [Penicillium cinerascens]|uniref:N-acetyltransferase domain-containing protein n=1 Tax=Penicillium cinerascens TaxID=70096 RepID=A0A9W9JHL7_9EURO|nr:uncharacterized protein N7498_007944 [Penicillium cinerascens]KAJ5194506.1 hypothetical protein N7498_007944 [Penicillium cinerascens]
MPRRLARSLSAAHCLWKTSLCLLNPANHYRNQALKKKGYRGNGLGATLCQKAVDYLRTCLSPPSSVQVRLMIKLENHVTVKMYPRLGFSEARWATLAKALTANGDVHLLPEDISGPKYK